MEEILKLFSTSSLFEATKALLGKLDVKFNPYTANSIPATSVYKDVYTNQLTSALKSISDIYFIGNISEDTLQSTSDSLSPDEVAENDEEKRYKTMMLFAMDAKIGETLTRTDIATLVRSLNRRYKAMPVMLFVRHGELLSLASCERSKYTQAWRIGEKLGKVAILKDINCNKPHRGHLDILKSMSVVGCSTFEDIYKHWQKIFNSELLTKKFYSDLFDWYQWAVDPDTKVSFPNDGTVQEDDRDDIDTKVIRLITRLMFVWFIKQKGLVPDCIFERDYIKKILKEFDPISKTSGNYYNAILQNLFFGTLNRAIIEDGEVRNFAKASRSDAKNLYRYEELFSLSESDVIKLFSSVPYMNCGLFECQDKTKTLDGVEKCFYNDGFSRNDKKFKDGTYKYRAVVPNVLFFHQEKGLLSIFEKYVFTIEENTPQDVQVALDPELLGKVFENLLGAYNPETKETARNQSGSFYTPREIVQYMVNESLVAHLKKSVGDDLEPKYRQLMDFAETEVDLTKEQKSKILHALFTCKILDPACGSGAFPMGMLQQMVHILRQVDPDNSMWKEVLLNMAVEESKRAFGIDSEDERKKKLLEIEETFNDGLNSPDYTRKLYIIESCIYGVDIQPIAMLITRLRFFISLICEQKEIRREDPEHNFGIKTLPNLESKFVAANSLIDADIHKYNEDWTANEELAILKNQLLSIRHRHFYTRKRSQKIALLRSDEEKRNAIQALISKLVGEPNIDKINQCKAEIEKLQKELPKYKEEKWVDEVVEKPATLFDTEVQYETIHYDKNKTERDNIKRRIKDFESSIDREYNKTTPHGFEAAVLEVTRWNPYDQNTVSPFLDIEWMFGLTDGFDIVIGNPPYIQLQSNGGELASLYQNCGYETFTRMGDIYSLFYERGWRLLKEHGTLSYITSNKWMRAGYGALTRNFFTTRTQPTLFIDFSETHVFDSACVMTNIIQFEKAEKVHEFPCVVVGDADDTSVKDLVSYVPNHSIITNFEGDESWVVRTKMNKQVRQKCLEKGTPLNEWDIQINYGIKSGFDKAFIISNSKRDEILNNCKSADERKITEDIIKPVLRGRDIKSYSNTWNDTWLVGTFPAMRLNIEKLPAIKSHLLSFSMERIEQTGKKYVIDGKVIKARKKASGKWFETQDSIGYWKEFSSPKIIYPNMTKFLPFVYSEDPIYANAKCYIINGEHLSFLVAFLNSSLFKYCYKDDFPVLFGGSRELQKVYFDQIPVIKVDDDTDSEFRKLVLDIQNEYTIDKAIAIDNKIFSMYELSPEEIKEIGFIDYHKSNEEEEEDDE